MDTPAGLWEAVSAFLGAATLYLGVLVRRARHRPQEERRTPIEIDYDRLQERLREFIDQRASHKARNVFTPYVARLDAMEGELARHMERTQKDIREFATVAGQLTEAVHTLKKTTENNGETLTELVRMVGKLEGARE